MTGDIDWGDHPDWRERLDAARKPRSAEQRRWDAHFDSQLRIVRRTHVGRHAADSAALRDGGTE